jgi:hypothetical protein
MEPITACNIFKSALQDVNSAIPKVRISVDENDTVDKSLW